MTEGGGQKAEDRRQGTEGRGRLKGGQMIGREIIVAVAAVLNEKTNNRSQRKQRFADKRFSLHHSHLTNGTQVFPHH